MYVPPLAEPKDTGSFSPQSLPICSATARVPSLTADSTALEVTVAPLMASNLPPSEALMPSSLLTLLP